MSGEFHSLCRKQTYKHEPLGQQAAIKGRQVLEQLSHGARTTGSFSLRRQLACDGADRGDWGFLASITLSPTSCTFFPFPPTVPLDTVHSCIAHNGSVKTHPMPLEMACSSRARPADPWGFAPARNRWIGGRLQGLELRAGASQPVCASRQTGMYCWSKPENEHGNNKAVQYSFALSGPPVAGLS